MPFLNALPFRGIFTVDANVKKASTNVEIHKPDINRKSTEKVGK
jgi:hypothetical protein